MNKRIVIWGTGKETEKHEYRYKNIVEYFIDNDSTKIGQKIWNKDIYLPNILTNEDREDIFIVVFSTYFNEISKQLVKMGFEHNVHFVDGRVVDYDAYKNIFIDVVDACNLQCNTCPRGVGYFKSTPKKWIWICLKSALIRLKQKGISKFVYITGVNHYCIHI